MPDEASLLPGNRHEAKISYRGRRSTGLTVDDDHAQPLAEPGQRMREPDDAGPRDSQVVVLDGHRPRLCVPSPMRKHKDMTNLHVISVLYPIGCSSI